MFLKEGSKYRMVNNIISKGQFESIMEKMQGQSAWLKIYTDIINVDFFYPKLEFLIFINGKYQFGDGDFDEEETRNQNIIIDKKDIYRIHRDEFSMTLDNEYITITMVDGTTIYVSSS